MAEAGDAAFCIETGIFDFIFLIKNDKRLNDFN